MKKKELSAVPRPSITGRKNDKWKKAKGIATAEIVEIGGQQVFVLNCFYGESLKPWFRLFCSDDDYITQDLTTEKVKWKTGSLEHIAGYCVGWSGGDISKKIIPASRKDESLVKRHFKIWLKDNGVKIVSCEFDVLIDRFQQKIRDKRLFEKNRGDMETIDGMMEKFGSIPDDYDEFVKKTVFDEYNFFFYDRKKKWAYWSRCGFEYEVRKDGVYHKKIGIWTKGLPKHNTDYVCPHCGKFTMAKSLGMSRNYMIKPQWSVLLQSSGEDVLVRYFVHTKDFRKDIFRPEIHTTEEMRTVHTEKKSEDYEWSYNEYAKVNRWNYPKKTWCWNPSEYVWPRTTVLYNEDFEVLKGTCMKYSCMKEFIEKVYPALNSNAFVLDAYMNFYRKHKSVEQIIKIGWYKLAAEFLKKADEPTFMKVENGRTILESLGITREQFKMLRSVCNNNPAEKDLRVLQYATEKGVRLREEDLETLRWKNDYKLYLDAMRYTSLHKLERYISENEIRVASDYFDYLRWIEEMGYDMRNEFNLYPRDFVVKHDEKSAEYMRYKDKKHREDVKKFNKLLKKMKKDITEDNPARMAVEGLFIRLPYSINELKKEGEFLHHCVGTYADRVMKGETSIFFIRQMSKPDVPFYTLEWKNHKIAQCRGMRNCGMTPEVKAFTVLFEEKMKAYENIQKKVG